MNIILELSQPNLYQMDKSATLSRSVSIDVQVDAPTRVASMRVVSFREPTAMSPDQILKSWHMPDEKHPAAQRIRDTKLSVVLAKVRLSRSVSLDACTNN